MISLLIIHKQQKHVSTPPSLKFDIFRMQFLRPLCSLLRINRRLKLSLQQAYTLDYTLPASGAWSEVSGMTKPQVLMTHLLFFAESFLAKIEKE
jgi:hypothetical protein